MRVRGFTLIELVMTVVLTGILAVIGSNMLSSTLGTASVVTAGNASEAVARYALERLAREIREVKYVSTGPTTGSYCIDTATRSATHFEFRKYVTGTPSSTCGAADVNVVIDKPAAASSLGLGYGASPPASSLADRVSNFALEYQDAGGNPTTDITNSAAGIRFVVISLTVTDPASGQTGFSQRTRVALRGAW